MAPEYDTDIDAGSYFGRQFTWRDSNGDPIDLTGFTAKSQVKATKESDPIVTLSDGSGITLGGIAGTVLLEFSSAQTLTFPDGEVVYDILLVDPGGKPARFIQGTFTVSAPVTTL